MLYCSQAQRITCSAQTLRLIQICVHSVPGVLVLRVKWPWYKADRLFPCTDVKSEWYCTSTCLCAFMAWCIIKHRDNLYLSLHGQLFGVLGLFVFLFYVSYRAVGLPVSSIQTYNIYPVMGEFLNVEH